MEYDLDKCPECGYINRSRPDICPSCGCNLKEYREKAIAEMKREEKEAQNAEAYTKALALYTAGEYKKAKVAFLEIGDYKESVSYSKKCNDPIYKESIAAFNKFELFAKLFANQSLSQKEANEVIKANSSVYSKEETYSNTIKEFKSLDGYKDSDLYIKTCELAKQYYENYDAEIKKAKELADKREAERRAQYQREENERYRIQRQKEEKIEKIEKALQAVALSIPIVLSIVFAIILFSNKLQIQITSKFVPWVMGWIAFTIASIVILIIFIKKNASHEWEASSAKGRVPAIIFAVLSLVSSIVVFSSSAKLERGFNPSNFITMKATSKTLSGGGSRYTSTIEFEVRNTSDVTVSGMVGEMSFYNQSNPVGKWTVSFSNTYNGGETYYTTVEFDEWDDPKLYSTSFENLKITYKISEMQFNNDYKVYSIDGELKTVK